MLKTFLAGCLLMTGLVIGVPTALAQTPTTIMTQATPTSTISQGELQQFANAFKQIVTIDNEAKQEVFKLVQASGMPVERIVEIDRSRREPNFKLSTPVSAQEKQTFEQLMTQVEAIDKSARTRMDQAIVAQKMEPKRFGEILGILQKDENLQKRVEELLKKS